MSTVQNIVVLVGNLTSISAVVIITVIGSLLKAEKFIFGITQRVHVVDEKIRSIINQHGDEVYLDKIAKFGYRYAIIMFLILVTDWPLPL
jgi:hypothetical protein